MASQTVEQTRSTTQIRPLLAEAFLCCDAAGADTRQFHGIDIHVTDLPGTALGLAIGASIWLDAGAASWGWFVDATAWEDSEFSTPGNQGEQGRMDLVTVLMHEFGHVLGYEHGAEGLMQETLSHGTRLARDEHGDTDVPRWTTDALFALLAVEEDNP
jgi:hypothetical protein